MQQTWFPLKWGVFFFFTVVRNKWSEKIEKSLVVGIYKVSQGWDLSKTKTTTLSCLSANKMLFDIMMLNIVHKSEVNDVLGSKQTTQNCKEKNEEEGWWTRRIIFFNKPNRLLNLFVYCWLARCFSSQPICALISPANFIRVQE